MVNGPGNRAVILVSGGSLRGENPVMSARKNAARYYRSKHPPVIRSTRVILYLVF